MLPGGISVPLDLVIVFSDHSNLERSEYDGIERWVFRKPIVIPIETKPLTFLFDPETDGRALAELHGDLGRRRLK